MKTKITLLAVLLFLGFNVSFAQDEECATNLSIMSEYAKTKNYDAAYEPFMKLRKDCARYSRAIYTYGEKILNYKIKNAAGTEKTGYINDLAKMWDERAVNFASKTPKGEFAAKSCQLMYDNRKELNKTNAELYQCFDAAYNADKATFTNPKSLYTYFSLMVDLFDAKEKSAQQLFDKYDDVVEKVESEVGNYSAKLNKLIAKEDAGTALTSKEGKYKKSYSSYLKAYDQISGSIDSKLGERANCSTLVPLYSKDFETNKSNSVWLQRAMNRMYAKGCKEDPLFLKLVQQKNSIEPNADTAFYLYLLTNEQRYFDQTVQLETDPFKKAKLYKKIAKDFKDRGSYGKARNYYQEALKLNPSDGRPHLSIAAMYNKSANSCGDSNFNKRAVFWLAANEAAKAGRVDPTLKSAASKTATSYRAKAPTKNEIFNAGNGGSKIKIGCWIGRTVTVPKV